MKLSIYHRNSEGKITYHGPHEWKTPACFIAACYPKKLPHEIEMCVLQKLPTGWPDKAAHWSGEWGYAIQVARPKLRAVNLTDDQVEVAKQIGSGNISEGIRIALRVVEQMDDISPYFQ